MVSLDAHQHIDTEVQEQVGEGVAGSVTTLPVASVPPPRRTRGPRQEARRFARRPLRHGRTRESGTIADGPSRLAVGSRDRRFRHLLAAGDGLAALLALLLAVAVIGDDLLRPVMLLAVPLVIVASKVMGLYDRDELVLRKSTLDEGPAIFQLATLYTLVAVLLGPLLVAGQGMGRDQILGLWASFLVTSLAARTGARALARRTAPAERCLIVGERDAIEPIARKLGEGHGLKAELVGHVPLDITGDHVRSMHDIADAIGRHDVHRVILAPRVTDTDAMLDVIRLVKSLGVKVSLLPRVFEVVGSSVEFDDLNGVTVLGVRRFGLSRSSSLLKRAVDLAGAGLGLLAVGPVMALIAVAIRLESPGSVFFRQIRVGRDGQRFSIFKFRTMVADAEARKAELFAHNEADGLFKIADDPRVTRVGRLLRKTSLDELPQLLNVMRGEMSLVGPRPLVVDEDQKVQGWHRRRLHLTPGMTGPWQILGSSRIPLHEMVKIDYLYVANWSFWNDMKILLRTVPYMIGQRGM
jgi:exopolysaccharide biosynthesis polyprenyl glycosylphosphotransferase